MTQADFVPEWAKQAIWYQIFPERFWNGDPNNDPTLPSILLSWPFDVTEPWEIHPWTSDWYAPQPYERAHSKSIWHHLFRRRYGGDLQGILDRLDYLQDLGINALYLNPVFQAPSLHKYDGATYHHIDPHFGPDPVGDALLIKNEIPNKPETWVWTAADLLMRKLINEVHQRGMYIIIDGVFNHMGLTSWVFQDLLTHGQRSQFHDWMKILDWNNPSQFAPFTYSGWSGVPDLPELNQDENGLVPGPKDYIFDITRRWMDPDGDGDPADGVDGWRLDVAFCIRHGFWKDWRKHVKSINPEAYLVAEIVTEDKNEPYLQGDEFDAVMNYLWMFACAEYFVESQNQITLSKFDQKLRSLREAYPDCAVYSMQNLLSSHDTARIASHIVNRKDITFTDWKTYNRFSKVHEHPQYDTRRPSDEERRMQKIMVLFQMTYVGAPMIYYGDEAGMWGANDPCCRKPMVWPELDYEPEIVLPNGSPRPHPQPVSFDHDLHAYYKKLISLRNSLPALQKGRFVTLSSDDRSGVYAFARELDDQHIVIIVNNSPLTQKVTVDKSGNWIDKLNGGRQYHATDNKLIVDVDAMSGCILLDTSM